MSVQYMHRNVRKMLKQNLSVALLANMTGHRRTRGCTNNMPAVRHELQNTVVTSGQTVSASVTTVSTFNGLLILQPEKGQN
jgi:hypothetical protein